MQKKTIIADIAAAAGVSTATVDRVLNRRGGVSPEKEGRVLDWARKLQVDRDLERRPTRLLRIGVVMQNPANPFYEELRQAFAKANSLYFGASLQTTLYYFDVKAPRETAEMLRKIAASQDALIVVLPDHQLITTTVQAIAAELPVVTMVSDLPQSGRMAYVGLDNRAAGRTAGELMGRFVGSHGGDIVVVSGLQSFIGQGEREMGFRAVLAERHSQCRLLTVLETREQPEKAGELVSTILKQTPDLAGVYNLSAGDSSIVGALRHFARTDKTVFITHELTPERKALLQEGVIDAIIDQNPELEAMTAVQLLARHFGRSGEEALPTTTPARIYIRENC
ncbi:MAG: LacI family DNA-binding transcriptional regulator [Propionivibrio sp.]|jgi:LacI family transcriptional regulator|uniref:LacI family DNA-binding transcriptional regulator n=1 Tax=Propionivibrio sp. TaxID=2212460 RepID=UPI001B60627F|nr:LacI family DNA-binding transcriptional regulator [Propionivibrio sp.]MBP7204110.1 LacI family DNA-binding transcriptional regulator [Propionivibrio sp.]MBP8215489.1 LacI family DNA-binding transcriptional regulator [Propionivibrio sp.]